MADCGYPRDHVSSKTYMPKQRGLVPLIESLSDMDKGEALPFADGSAP